MTTTDPIADYFTRIRNALLARHDDVLVPYSKIKEQISQILVTEGFIKSFEINDIRSNIKQLSIKLKYTKTGRPVISSLKRISRPSNRFYVSKSRVSKTLNGFGISILSTNKGVLTGRQARINNLGGELIGEVC